MHRGAQTPRGSFWWKDVFSLIDLYWSFTTVSIHYGRDTLFWKDLWHKEGLLCDMLPHLYSFTFDEDIYVTDMLQSQDHAMLFSMPLSMEASSKLTKVQDLATYFVPKDHANDIRIFSWGNATYSSSRLYNSLFPCGMWAPCPSDLEVSMSSQIMGVPMAPIPWQT